MWLSLKSLGVICCEHEYRTLSDCSYYATDSAEDLFVCTYKCTCIHLSGLCGIAVYYKCISLLQSWHDKGVMPRHSTNNKYVLAAEKHWDGRHPGYHLKPPV